jgi:acetyl-CoA carboxylase carboxyl transferase subunit alpha
VAYRRQGARRRRGDAGHRAGPRTLGIIDTIVPEPLGGAHRDPAAAIAALGDALDGALGELSTETREQLRHGRGEKFLAMGRLPG